jgi:hypothetical protein
MHSMNAARGCCMAPVPVANRPSLEQTLNPADLYGGSFGFLARPIDYAPRVPRIPPIQEKGAMHSMNAARGCCMAPVPVADRPALEQTLNPADLFGGSFGFLARPIDYAPHVPRIPPTCSADRSVSC